MFSITTHSSNINTVLPYVHEVAHLGHVLSYNLDDTPDIIRAVRDMNRKVNSILFTFQGRSLVVSCVARKPPWPEKGGVVWSLLRMSRT